jgi:RNA polymerase sigma-70 factor (ECF subfamily)
MQVRGASDADHVAAARAGDRAAFGRLFRRYAPMVHGVLLARVRPSEVDDLMQDVFVAALEKLSGLRDGDAFGPWLGAMAKNRAIDHYRAREPLVLRLVEGMTGPEIAAQVGLEPGSVRVNLHRGMKLLREKLGLSPVEAPAALEAEDG